jgi:hypothetical protein
MNPLLQVTGDFYCTKVCLYSKQLSSFLDLQRLMQVRMALRFRGKVMKSRSILSACLVMFWVSFVLAQTSSGKPASSNLSSSTLSDGINLRSIAGAPFSADVVKESTRLQADGTRAAIETRGKMFRDSAGRTRSETELLAAVAGMPSRHFVTIIDPVQQLSIVLDVDAKTAAVFHLPDPPAVSAREMKLISNAHATHSSGGSSAKEQSTEDLGATMMEGFSVSGTRRTHPAEAGTGNNKALNAVTDSWFSPDLKVELSATIQVSQSVSRTTRLTNIVPGEPDPALFQVPYGYMIQESSGQK